MMDLRDVIVRPIVTEKSTMAAEAGKYVFEVADRANKTQIREAVESIFEVNVTQVNVSRVRGKWRRFGRSRGKRPDWKKATVTLESGQTIEIFAGV